MGRISFIMPAYNEEANIEKMVARIESVAGELAPDEVEMIFVDDHSTDRTPSVLREACKRDARVRYARLARRSGSHLAVLCGIHMSRGDCAMVLAADGQDPPELAPEMIARWRQGQDVVWGVREQYRRPLADRAYAALYARVMRLVSDVSPESQNADMVLLDRKVLDVLGQVHERNMYLWGLIDWFGFKQARVLYDKQPRAGGRSGWTFLRKLKAAADSLFGFSYAPIRFMSLMGIAFSVLSFSVAVLCAVNQLTDGLFFGFVEVPGWVTIVCAIFFLGGLQMLMLGILGEYLWRTFDQVRGRPLYLVEEGTGPARRPPKRVYTVAKDLAAAREAQHRPRTAVREEVSEEFAGFGH